jgi:glycine cleavage system H lipoate-binding protein/ABC-type phosphate transport system substrate-binding protein
MANNGDPAAGSTVTVRSTPDVNDLAVKWVAEFEKQNPGIPVRTVNSVESAGQGPDAGSLRFFADSYANPVSGEIMWKMVVGRDAIVPVFSESNPMLKEIWQKGVTLEALAEILSGTGKRSWGALVKDGKPLPLHLYMVDDPAVTSAVNGFLNRGSLPEGTVLAGSGADLIAAVQKDPNALGFCRIRDVAGMEPGTLAAKVKLLPFDKNGNGRMDAFEMIYGDMTSFLRGIWIGKYPHELCRNICFTAPAKPTDPNEVAFLKWIITGGQQYLNPEGYSDLASGERDAKFAMLGETGNVETIAGERYPYKSLTIFIVMVILAGGIVAGMLWHRRQKNTVTPIPHPAEGGMPHENSLVAPAGLFYDKSHTWAFMERNGLVRIGIDDFLQHVTGPVTRIRMKSPGEQVTKGEKILSIIQNGKQLNIQAPVSGTIREYNSRLLSDASLVNQSPYGQGWIYMIEPANWIRETGFMFMTARYHEWLRNEFARLRDFFASSEPVHAAGGSRFVMQDGGELRENILAGFGPEVWEDFQTRFIDTAI